jgi:hypothetical protein
MSELTIPPLPTSQGDFSSPTLLTQALRLDQSLHLLANARWRESRQGLHELIAQAPGVRDSISGVLKEQLQMGPGPVGLGIFKTEQDDESFISLTDAWAFICQFPDISPSLDTQCTTVGLAGHRLANLTPIQLLGYLNTLNLEQLLKNRWNAYWAARAPGTPLSRTDRVVQLYRQHIEACGQTAYALGHLSTEQLHPLQTRLNPGPFLPGETHQLALNLPDQSKVKLPGAWVISASGPPPLTQTLYLPSRQPSLMVFSERREMEQWLTAPAQQLIPSDVPATSVTFDYTLRSDALDSGAHDVLEHLLTAQLESLRNRHRNGSNLARYARNALDDADRLDRQRHENPLFALPPTRAMSGPDDDDLPTPFGNLNADITLSERWASIKQQRLDLERYLGGDAQYATQLAQLKLLMQAQDAAEQAGNDAASALLGRRTALERLELRHKPNAHYDALYQAQLAAVRAEAAIQHALKQISDDEHRLLLALLDHPAAAERRPEVTAARLILVSSDPSETTHELEGLLVITRTGALTASTPQSLLLYWPGNGGGLQRFESRQALDQSLFKLPGDASTTLQWAELSGDPFEHSLQQRLYASEQQAAEAIMRYPVPALAHQRDEALGKLHEQTLSTLLIPTHQARGLAYTQLLEQQRSVSLAGALPGELSQLSADARHTFKRLIKAQINALHHAQQLLERDLEPFQDFGRRRLNQRLREDFKLEHDAHVQLNLPDSVSWERQLLDQHAGPGTPFKNVLVPSARRSNWSLLQLAQQNIDTNVEQRLGFRQVTVTSQSPIEADRLKNGLTLDYLKKLVTELDLAGAYEHLITRTFLGDPDTPLFTRQHQRECLSEPLRLMLILQGKFARAQGRLDDTDLLLLNNAVEARQPFVLLPAQLSAGGADTDHSPSGLFGITFIQDPVSGRTLLYLPDTPDGQPLRRYASLELARKAVYDRSLASGMGDYLAGRAIKGDAAAHLSRIVQAQQKNFDAMVEVGARWPATTSLPEHLLNSHMGRVIEAHRATSRSNAALLLEQNALRSGMIFNYLKIALGLVPFVGTAIALYDAWNSANLAVAAFLRGDIGHGLAEVEAVLLSLIDCAMDILPGSAGLLPTNARAATRQRQLRHLRAHPASLHLPSATQARRALQRFDGYEYEGVVSLAGLQPHSHGPYRNIYRHGDGDFIVRRGRIYKVERLGDALDWRLSPTRQKSYKQPIALDESGEWDTHYGVYGTAFNGGLAGGGGVLGHVADVLEPMWPLAIRERLPRWLVDRTYYRQRALASSVERTNDAALRQKDRIKSLTGHFESGDMGVIPNLEKELADSIELNSRLYQDIEGLTLGAHGNKGRLGGKAKSDAACSVVWNSQWQAKIKGRQLVINDEAIDLAVARLDATPYEQLSARATLREQIRAREIAILDLLRQLDSTIETMNSWIKRVTIPQQRQGLTSASEVINRHLSARHREQMKVETLLELVDHRKGIGDASWHYLQGPLNNSKSAVHRALYLQANMLEVSATQSQRNTLLNYCVDVYAQMRGNLNRWTASYRQHFDAAYVQALIDELNKMSERARKALTEPTSRAPAGSTRRIFETDDQTLLIGVEHVDPVTKARRYTLTGAEGRTEIWEQGANGRFHLTNPAPVAPPVRAATNALALIDEARARLNAVQAYQRKVEEYARQNMLPVDLEEMLAREAEELLERARTIGTLVPRDPILAQLRTQAASLTTQGRNLRVRQTLASQTPTEGYLDYLREQQLVEIRKGEPARNLNAGQKGRPDYLQEYVVWDVSKTPQQLLWYAHFHYDKAGARFDEFIKAHLKIPEQRNLGLQWQRAQAEAGASVDPIWRGNIGRPLANRHFAEL